LECAALHDAITAAHDRAFSPIQKILSSALPTFDCHWMTPAGLPFPNLRQSHASLADVLPTSAFRGLDKQVPDGILLSPTLIVLLEFTRTSDATPHSMAPARAAKELKYHALLQSVIQLYPDRRVHLGILVLGTRASIPLAEWTRQLEPLPLRASTLKLIFHAAAEGAILAMHDTWCARSAALKARNQSHVDHDEES
jgi:hypothetical protein